MADNQTTEMPNMRDIFAMMALMGVLARENLGPDDTEIIPEFCYRMADQMIKERQK